jgi:hypothetical protein
MSLGLSYEYGPDDAGAYGYAIPDGFEFVRYGSGGMLILRKLVDNPPPGQINSWIYKPGPDGYLERNMLMTHWTSPIASEVDAFGGSAGFLPSYNPITALATGVPQIGQDAQQSPGVSLYDLIGRALQVYQLDRQQKAFLETNQQLIAQGRPPIAWDQFQPTASVGVQLDSQTKQMLMLFGGGALALLALMALRR